MNRRKVRLLWNFYQNQKFILIPIFLLANLASPESTVLIMTIFSSFVIMLFTTQFRKNDFYFYYNNQISQTALFGFLILSNLILSSIYLLIYTFVFKLFS